MNQWRTFMNTRDDNHAPFADGHRSHPASPLSAALASADRAFIDTLEKHEEIEFCAFYRWEAAGRPSGGHVHFWLEAEKERAERTAHAIGRDGRSLDHSLGLKADGENAHALDASVDSHYRDNNRMFQQHGDRGHRHGAQND
jgi:hypothetical protein